MLPVGEYKLIETFSPEGYAPVKNEVYFEVKPETGIQTVRFENDVTKVMISKVDITNQQEMEGAELQILHTDGSPVYQNGELLKWTSGKDGKDENGNLKPHYIEMLPVGEYKLVETFSPEGYVAVSNEVYFEVKPETGIQNVRFENDVTKVVISKKDFTTGNELPGAKLQILHADHTPVYQDGQILEWVSDDKPHEIKKLPIGDYILVETIYPEGYQPGMIVDGIVTSEYNFTVKDRMTVKIDVFNESIKKVPSTASSATPTYVLGSMIALAGVGTITFAKKKNKEEM